MTHKLQLPKKFRDSIIQTTREMIDERMIDETFGLQITENKQYLTLDLSSANPRMIFLYAMRLGEILQEQRITNQFLHHNLN